MRYRNDNDLDDNTVTHGDSRFVRLNTRVNGSDLQPGEVQQSENMRLDSHSAKVRKGLAKVNSEIALSDSPLVLPFDLDDSPVVKTTYIDGVYGHGMFSDPDNDNQEWLVLATNAQAWLWRDGETAVDIDYPSGELCDTTDTVHIEQVNEKVYLFRGYDDTGETDGTCVWDAVTADDWQAATTYYADEIVRSTADDYIAVCTTGGTSHATTEPTWAGGTGQTDGTVTWTTYPLAAWAATTAYSSTYDAADETFRTIDSAVTVIRCTTSGTSGSTEPDMKDRPVMYWDGDQTTDFINVTQKRPVAATYRALTAAPWSLYFRNRLTKPITRDRLRVSDVATIDATKDEQEQFDSVDGDFPINLGSADYIVGVSPFQEDALLVFKRNSIHIITDFSGSLANAAVQEVIRGIGCAARKTIVSAGEQIYWLGDGGIYSLNIVDQLNLKSVEIPLTRDINDIFQTINTDAVDKSHGTYYNNRLYFAVPTGAETRPNKVLVYNLLNQGWESIDTYAPYVDGFEVAEYTSTIDGVNIPTKRLIMITRDGALYVMEEDTTGDETGQAGEAYTQTDPVLGILETRDYNNGRSIMSRFRRANINAYAPAAATFDVTGNLHGPDSNVSMGTATIASTGDIIYRKNISRRGYAGSIQINSVTGMPEIRSVAVEATHQYRAGEIV